MIPFTMYGYPKVLVQVEYSGALSDATVLGMTDSAPIVFTDADSTAIAINQDPPTRHLIRQRLAPSSSSTAAVSDAPHQPASTAIWRPPHYLNPYFR